MRKAALVLAATLGLSGCTAPAQEDGLRIVATTPIIADLARNVAPDAHVTTLIPAGKDPHSFAPTLRTSREVANADIAFANGLLFEPQTLMDSVRSVSSGPVVDVADVASTRGAKLVPLVENVALDAIWLGLRVAGSRDSATISLDSVEGPGSVAAYVVSTFGTPRVLFNSSDGSPDSTELPANAHTHLSWAFSAPGIYRLHVSSSLTQPAVITIAVGVTPPPDLDVIEEGHLDIAADSSRGIVLRDGSDDFDPAASVIAVPSSVLQEIPPDPSYRFLGVPGSETYLLPQAVLGQHIHGEVDPHLWHNAANAMAYVDVIADELAQVDPSHGAEYRDHARAYNESLREVDFEVRSLIADIPEPRRNLVTTHHGYAYLEQGYGVRSAGFVTPNPAVEPSPRDVIALRRTLENLDVPAVFIEPSEEASTQTLRETAAAAGRRVCTIYGDTLDASVPTYIDLMRFNARSLHDCLKD